MGKSNPKGNFIIKNVKEGIYRLYALKGGNTNYKYVPVTNAIAFDDSLLNLNPMAITLQPKKQAADTLKNVKPVQNRCQ